MEAMRTTCLSLWHLGTFSNSVGLYIVAFTMYLCEFPELRSLWQCQ